MTTNELEQIIENYNIDASNEIYDTIEEVEIGQMETDAAYKKILNIIVKDILKK